jgi:mitochondrial fission protein ELM1
VAKAFVPHIQNPKVPRQRFDLIAAPLHDGYTGANVINTFGAVHSVTPKRPAEAAQSFAARIEPLPRPRIAVLLGGDSAAFIPATADAIVTAEDSVNMVTKATGTGKPVYVQRLKGSSTRLGRFHELMRERGATRPFAGKIESWSYVPINDTELVAAAMRRSLGLETLA